ncbi:hypothetical protein AB0H03_12140 [Streptomyces sparsogenes]|uniref:hypothetical protein n=1 Tax=Streptomyces sparsogenes TaxID=67365 RepID=UPI0033D352F0
MTTRFDDGPEFPPDDPLAVILRPPADHLGPPPGRYEAIRRAAGRRRLLRAAAAGVGLSCAVAALIALPLHLTSPESPATPSVPLAPPATSGPTAPLTPSPFPDRRSPVPTDRRPTAEPGTPSPSTADQTGRRPTEDPSTPAKRDTRLQEPSATPARPPATEPTTRRTTTLPAPQR